MRATLRATRRASLGSQPACFALECAQARADILTQKQYLGGVPTIVLNGESRSTTTGQSVAELIRELGLDSRSVAVERNREVVPRAEHGSTVLAEGDQLEVVTFVGGG